MPSAAIYRIHADTDPARRERRHPDRVGPGVERGRSAETRRVAPDRDACPVCGATARTVILDAEAIVAQLVWLDAFHRRRLTRAARERHDAAALEDRARFTQDEPRAIVGCRSCALVFRHPRRTPDAVTEAYAADRYGEARLQALFAAQTRAYDGKIAGLARALGRGRRPRVLEVGSFVGGFLTAAGVAGWDVVGVDPGAEVVAFCRRRGLPVEQGTLEEVGLASRTFDAVAIWNTFDQLPAPGAVLAKAARLLRPGGVLAVRVPNGRFFADTTIRLAVGGEPEPIRRWRLLALAWNNLLGFPYLHGYSVATLDRLVAPYGFERLDAVPDTLLPLADADTRWWAACEERLVKAACRVAWRRQIPGPARVAAAPWLDVYYRRPAGSAR